MVGVVTDVTAWLVIDSAVAVTVVGRSKLLLGGIMGPAELAFFEPEKMAERAAKENWLREHTSETVTGISDNWLEIARFGTTVSVRFS